MYEFVLLMVLVFTGFLLLLYKRLWVKNERLKLDLQEAMFKQRSQASKYGKMTEQFIPFLDSYPYDEQNFRFLGSPIDGVQFEDDRVVFVEFKTASSKLSKKQQDIRELVKKGKVEFQEFRIPEK